MRRLGFLIAAVGIVGIFAALMMDTTVATQGGARVNSLSLMADRQLYTLFGGIVLVAGVLIALIASRRLASGSQALSTTRSCPACAQPVAQTAASCTHCGADVEPVPGAN